MIKKSIGPLALLSLSVLGVALPASGASTTEQSSDARIASPHKGDEERSPWGGKIALSMSRGLVQDSFYTLGFSGEVTYDIGKTSYVGGALAYTHTLTEFVDKNLNNAYDDTVLFIGDSSLWSNRENMMKLGYSLSWILPTSRTSRTASMTSGFALDGMLSKKMGNFILSGGNTFYLYDHKYKTANVEGTLYNELLADKPYLKGSLALSDDWSVGLEGSLYIYSNRAGSAGTVASAGTSLDYRITPHVSAKALIQSKNELVVNNSLFDEENTQISIGMGLNL